MNYIIITPAHNEENYIHFILDSVVKQTLLPEQWIIVNDGSVDRTSKIVDKYQKKFEWIKLINNTNKEKRALGSKVIKAFYAGFNTIKNKSYDFIVKLDADLTLPQNYFEEVAKGFRNDPKVGLCGGYCSVERNGEFVREKSAKYHSRGSIKAYRKKCFDQIGGLKPILGWDGIDEMTAMMLGWRIRVLPLEVIHHRKTNTSVNFTKLRFECGEASYKNGDTIIIAFSRMIYRLFQGKIVNSLAGFSGYLYAMIFREKKNIDKNLEKFIRNFQYNRIKK